VLKIKIDNDKYALGFFYQLRSCISFFPIILFDSYTPDTMLCNEKLNPDESFIILDNTFYI